MLYGTLLAGDPVPAHPLAVDAYAAQHPGVESPQAVQSVAAHIITLNASLARGVGIDLVTLRARAVELGRDGTITFGWMDPAPDEWASTIVDVTAGVPQPVWAGDVLAGWMSGHGALIDDWTDVVLR